jgi:hypothetical protein
MWGLFSISPDHPQLPLLPSVVQHVVLLAYTLRTNDYVDIVEVRLWSLFIADEPA